MRRFRLTWGVFSSLLLISACSSSLHRGSTLYSEQRYVDAAEVFERSEVRLRTFSPAEQAEYGLYRGLNYIALGDLNNAQRWLSYAFAIDGTYPGALSPYKRAMLEHGWYDLGYQTRKLWGSSTQQSWGTAVAQRQAGQPKLEQGSTSAPSPEAGKVQQGFAPHRVAQ